MASFKVNGIDDLCASFAKVEKVPPEQTKKMLNAMGEVAKKAIQNHARTDLQGEYYQDLIYNATTKKEPELNADGGKVQITFKGSVSRNKWEKNTRIAEIAFVNEFGKTTQKARPFISDAIEECGNDAEAEGRRVFDEWLNSNGL